jgi:anaerobic ribonucleoside-triphosphate reductase activating protein
MYPYILSVLETADYLIDGRFVEELKNLRLKFRGSSNQRIIDVKNSLLQKAVVLMDE